MALVKKYKSEIVRMENPVNDIYTVEIRSMERPFRYKPGQFLHLALDEYNPSQPWPDSRCFSMRSNESEDTIRIAFSVKGAYTRRMSEELKAGKIVYLKLPYGDLFSRPHAKQRCVFIAGGTGIVPFLSLFTSPTFSEYDHPRLYFGARNRSYNIYGDDLHKAASVNPDCGINTVIENESGMLDIDAIYQENGGDSIYFISGPPVMINTFRRKLLEHGVDENNILTDDWE